jgi:electron transfer flavoprotein alpha/beta subunit
MMTIVTVSDPNRPLPPDTTAQNDLIAHGQRRINLIWETTQAIVTVLITSAAIYCAVQKIEADIVNFAFVAIVSTYYARTNHTKIGGVGQDAVGR